MGSPRVTFDAFVERSNKIHNSKYDYSKVDWVNTKTKVEIICPIHGSFLQKPFKHLQGQGCPSCRKNATVTQDEFIRRAKAIHGDGTYDYSRVHYETMWTPVEIICPIHGSFLQTPAKHVKTGKYAAEGCPDCRYIRQRQTLNKRYGVDNPMRKKEFVKSNWVSKKKNGTCQTSQPENKMHKILIDVFGEHDVDRHHCDDVRYPFACDFYIKSRDIFIELNGTWFHGRHWFDKNNADDIETLKMWQNKFKMGHKAYGQAITIWTVSDPLKFKTAKENGLNYFVFWDNDLTDFRKWLSNYTETSHMAQSVMN